MDPCQTSHIKVAEPCGFSQGSGIGQLNLVLLLGLVILHAWNWLVGGAKDELSFDDFWTHFLLCICNFQLLLSHLCTSINRSGVSSRRPEEVKLPHFFKFHFNKSSFFLSNRSCITLNTGIVSVVQSSLCSPPLSQSASALHGLNFSALPSFSLSDSPF